ncbi:MAG: type I restriction-modification system subunit M [Anaerolineae bacterium]|nr:type I restriction-modification system subunit M [Anaerolineae bacterium]
MRQNKQAKGKVFLTQQSLNRAIKNICDVLRRSNCAGAMQYIPELTWMLFLRILDEQETLEAENRSLDKIFSFSIEPPYRWQDWAAPYEISLFHDPYFHKPQGWKRRELEDKGEGALLDFINSELFPYLKSLGAHGDATPRQKVISEIIANIGLTRIDTEYNLLDVLNQVHQISLRNIDPTHIFPLSQLYEGLLLRMGQKSNDGGQFFTPREIVRVMVNVIDPKPGETIYDPCCGTGGFLAQAYEHIHQDPETCASHSAPEYSSKNCSFYGREKENLVYPIALANLILHGLDEPHLWHGNTLTGQEFYGGLFQDAPSQFDVILTNPPFGGKESKQAQAQFSYKSSSTQLLFLQHVIDSLKPQGRCGIVVDEGILFRTNDTAFGQTKRKLLETCNLWCIVSLPIGTFTNAGASIKTNILFFTKGQPTKKIWYYDLSDVKIGKNTPLTFEHFREFFQLLPQFAESERSWSVTRNQIEENGYDLKAVNPNFQIYQDTRSLGDLLRLIEERNREIQDNLHTLSLYSKD